MPVFKVIDSNGFVSCHLCKNQIIAIQAHIFHYKLNGALCLVYYTDDDYCRDRNCLSFIKECENRVLDYIDLGR